jgi:hypothetical protein
MSGQIQTHLCKMDARQTAMWCLGRHFKYPQFMAILENRTVYGVFQKRIQIVPDIILLKIVIFYKIA